jgi:hypothetical protein
MARQDWQHEYPWLALAFRQLGPTGRTASEEWRWRIEDDLKAPLDYQVRSDGTAAVWCGLARHDFEHEPTPKDLLQGLDAAYREELERRGWQYPDLHAAAVGAPGDPVSVATRHGPVEIPGAARDQLVEEIRQRGTGDLVARIFEAVGSARPVNLDRKGKIVVFDALWAIAESAGGYDRLDTQLRELQDRLKVEIAEGA